MSTDATLTSLIDALIAGEAVAPEHWPEELGAFQNWGLALGAQGLRLAESVEALRDVSILDHLGGRGSGWMRRLEVHSAIGSTSDRLLGLAETGSVDGVVCLAEMQTKGRGRRGRTWLTPLGGNLALSAGFAVQRELSDLGGLSLVVGLALLDALRDLGVADLKLKWPNDLLFGGAKLGGILVELRSASSGAGATEAIVGVGINVSLPQAARGEIDQQVTDLASTGSEIGRNRLAAALLDSMIDYVKAFEESGFAPLREQYDMHHGMHGRNCEVRLGAESVSGRVSGVTESGELALETDAGERVFRAGEVSLRQRG